MVTKPVFGFNSFFPYAPIWVCLWTFQYQSVVPLGRTWPSFWQLKFFQTRESYCFEARTIPWHPIVEGDLRNPDHWDCLHRSGKISKPTGTSSHLSSSHFWSTFLSFMYKLPNGAQIVINARHLPFSRSHAQPFPKHDIDWEHLPANERNSHQFPTGHLFFFQEFVKPTSVAPTLFYTSTTHKNINYNTIDKD